MKMAYYLWPLYRVATASRPKGNENVLLRVATLQVPHPGGQNAMKMAYYLWPLYRVATPWWPKCDENGLLPVAALQGGHSR